MSTRSQNPMDISSIKYLPYPGAYQQSTPLRGGYVFFAFRPDGIGDNIIDIGDAFRQVAYKLHNDNQSLPDNFNFVVENAYKERFVIEWYYYPFDAYGFAQVSVGPNTQTGGVNYTNTTALLNDGNFAVGLNGVSNAPNGGWVKLHWTATTDVFVHYADGRDNNGSTLTVSISFARPDGDALDVIVGVSKD